MKESILLLLLLIPIIPAYADNVTSGFQEPIMAVFDWLGEIFSNSIENADLENSTKNNLNDTLDSGIDAGKVGTSLWFKVHAFFVNLLFSGASEAGFDESIKSLIVWVSMIAVFFFLMMIVLKLLRENSKVALIVIGILILIGVAGIVIEF